MIDRRLLVHFDWLMLAILLMLAAIGLMSIYSATVAQSLYAYNRQSAWLVVGAVILLIVILTDYAYLDRFAYPIFGLSLLLLVLVLLIGKHVGGSQRWISLGFISFQPSEFSKIAFIIAISKYFSTKVVPPGGLTLKDLLTPTVILMLPFLLIAKEPDLGTALSLFLVFVSLLLVVKVNRRTFIGLCLAFTPFIPLAWYSLKGYQKKRILSFIDPTTDPLGAGYHLLQSKIAIGSGGLFGKGFLEGTQGKLSFLPEHHTDFIFPIFAEEWGLFGAVFLLILYISLVLRGFNTAGSAKDRFGFLLAYGLSAMFFWHSIINIGMVTGLLPVVGIPLPFMSYGGSFLLTSIIGVAILINIRMRRFIF